MENTAFKDNFKRRVFRYDEDDEYEGIDKFLEEYYEEEQEE